MKIGLDLRFMKKGDEYSNFVFKLVQTLINNEKNNFYNIYLDLAFSHINFGENTNNIVVGEKPGSLKEQKYFFKILKSDKNNLTIFFDYRKPLAFKDKNIVFLSNLVDFHYPDKKNIFKKYFDNLLLNKNSSNATKIICFNELSKNEINDKLNINEEKIVILPAFFDEEKELEKTSTYVNIDIKNKYNINGDYIIYSAGAGTYKNLERLVSVLKKIKEANIDLNLVIIDDSSIKDVTLRKNIIEGNLQDKVYFIGSVNKKEEELFYKDSLGVIFPYFYESFPFIMNDAINYKTPILSSDINNIKYIFGDTITYFKPTNSFDMYEKIVSLKKERKKTNYGDIQKKYNISVTSKELIKTIKEV